MATKKVGILDKRRKEGWRITFWCEKNSVICQIITPEQSEHPAVDVAFKEFQCAVEFARSVCRRTPNAVDAASALVDGVPPDPEMFLALLASQTPRP